MGRMRRKRGGLGWGVGVVLAAAGTALVPAASAYAAPPDAPPAHSASTWQESPLHDGYSPTQLRAPLRHAWTHDFGAVVGYPVAVGGRVFVTAAPSGPGSTSLWALHATDGAVAWGPVAIGGTSPVDGTAADSANVYAVNSDGLLRALSQSTGSVLWSRQLTGQTLFSSSPTVRGGTVYVEGSGTGGTLYTVDATTGTVGWTAPVISGDHSSPTVLADRVIVGSACKSAQAFDRVTGSPLWEHTENCPGGGGTTPAVHNDLVYARDATDTGRLLSTATGARTGVFVSATVPAFVGSRTFFMKRGSGPGLTLTATSPVNAHWTAWSQVGDGSLVTAPLAIGDSVAVGSSSGRIDLYDQVTGVRVWSADAGSPIIGPDDQSSGMAVGLSEADGLLLVPATNTLVAYASGPSRAATRSTLGPPTSQLDTPFWFHDTVRGTAGGGTVSFFLDGSATPMPGCAAAPLAATPTGWQAVCGGGPAFGAHTVTAAYSGDAASAPSKVTITHVVGRAKTTVSLQQVAHDPVDGFETYTLWAQLGYYRGAVAGPPLTFSRDGVVLCTLRTNQQGSAHCLIRKTGRPIQVSFAGSPHYRPSSAVFGPTFNG